MRRLLNLIDTHFNSKFYSFQVVSTITKNLNNNLDIYLKQTVILLNCKSPSEKEKEIIQNRIFLYNFYRPISCEKEDYFYLKHSQLVESLRKYPGNYLAFFLKLNHDLKFIPAY